MTWEAAEDTTVHTNGDDSLEQKLAAVNLKKDDDTANEPQPVIDPRAGNEEHAAAVRAHGWAAPRAYDYATYQSQDASVQWHGNADRYEWTDEYGDVAPRVPELERVLFGGEHQMRVGDNLEGLTAFECNVDGPKRLSPILAFEDAGLHPVMLENLKLCGYSQPTPIQAYTIPYGVKGTDMVAVAQTGSGKTAAYMIPVLSKLMGKAKRLRADRPAPTADGYLCTTRVRAEPLVLIVVPTRELAIQIFDEARRLCYRSMLRPCVAYGGMPMGQCCDELGKGCDILIGTPGRLSDLIDRASTLSMKRVMYTIIDEADELLASDWEDELRKIISGGDVNTDADHVFMLFSATFPPEMLAIANEYLAEDHTTVTIGRVGSTHRNIKQDIIWVDGDQKKNALFDLLMDNPPARTLIFANSRRIVDELDDFLYNRDFPTTSIHSGRMQHEREDSLRAFRSGDCPILIATGLSSRGWDVRGIGHVINYDLPSGAYGGLNEYVHRIGRTARIGNTGRATSFYNDRDEDIARPLTQLLLENGAEIPHFLSQYVHEDGKPHFEEEDLQTVDGDHGVAITDDNNGTEANW